MASRRVLIVEDEEANRLLLRRFLGAKGFDVVEAANAHDALREARRPDVDVVLLDIMMPGGNGLDVLATLREEGQQVPIILLTAIDDSATIVRGLDLGADDYITKPFSLPVLLARILRRLRPEQPQDLDLDAAFERARAHQPARPPPPPEDIDVEADAIVEEQLEVPPAIPGVGVVLGGRYRLVSPVDRGAFGEVWRAHHIDLELDVAVKILRRDARPVRDGESPEESFRREAVRASRVRHQNVLHVVDYGLTEDARPYLVMDLLTGRTLLSLLASGPLSADQALRVVADVLAALAAAHRVGVIHHDVKASNVFLHDDGARTVTKLIDFGAAAEDGPDNSVIVVGTPSHMSPERLHGEPATDKSDVYAAGVLLYHALTGALPYVDALDDDLPALRARRAKDPEQPSRKNRALTRDIDGVVMALLRRQAAARPTAEAAALLVMALYSRTDR